METIMSFVMLIIIFGLYMTPSIVALVTKKNNTVAIMVLNILLGWSGIGWVVALIWAFTKDNNK